MLGSDAGGDIVVSGDPTLTTLYLRARAGSAEAVSKAPRAGGPHKGREDRLPGGRYLAHMVPTSI